MDPSPPVATTSSSSPGCSLGSPQVSKQVDIWSLSLASFSMWTCTSVLRLERFCTDSVSLNIPVLYWTPLSKWSVASMISKFSAQPIVETWNFCKIDVASSCLQSSCLYWNINLNMNLPCPLLLLWEGLNAKRCRVSAAQGVSTG